MKLAHRVSSIQPSATLALAARAKALSAQGTEVVDFGLGEPDFDTPEGVKDAAIRAIRAGFTKYTAPGGIEDLKAAVVEKLNRDNGLRYEKNQVVVSCGAKHTLFNLAQVLFESGDEVLIPSPYWVSYPAQIRLAGATPIIIDTDEEDGFLLSPDLLIRHITPRTKALILNSPCNPTGSVYPRKRLEKLASIILEKKLLVISDEIYEPFVYDEARHISLASIDPAVAELTVVVNGVSKSHAMTGWRIGYAAGPRPIIAAVETVQSQSTSNPTSISQKAAIAALRGDSRFTKSMVAQYDQRRRALADRLNKIPGLSCALPQGAFYAFPNIAGLLGRRWENGLLKTADDLTGYLLDKGHIAVVGGDAFGAPRHIRISYATPLDRIELGMDRMAEAIAQLKT